MGVVVARTLCRNNRVVEAEVPASVAILEGDSDSSPVGLIVVALAALDRGHQPLPARLGREAISNIRSAVMHADYSHDMAELREGRWVGTEADYQKILHHRLHTMYLKLNYVVRPVDPQTGRFVRDWTPGRALCASCKTKALTI